MRENKIIKNAVFNTIKTVLGIFFPLITYPYVARVLGVDNLGIYTFSFSFLSYFLLIAALGISTYGIREGVQYREDRKQIQSFVSELFSINIISTIVSYILLFVFLYKVSFMAPYRKGILILSAEIFFTTLGESWVCNVYEDFFAIAVRTIVFQIISIILIFVFVRDVKDLYKYMVILLISNSGANVVNFFYIRKKYFRIHLTTKINWKIHLKPILIIFSTTVAITVYVSSDTTMIGFMTNDFQVGLYGTAVKIYTIIKNIFAAILIVLIPKFSLLFLKGDQRQLNELFSKVFNILTVFMLPICVGLFSLSDDIVCFVFGRAYLRAAEPLRLLSIAITFSLYAYMYIQCVLIPSNKEKIVFCATVVSAILNIGLNFILIPLWGINAAAITTIIAEFITFVISIHYSRNTVRLIGVRKDLISTMLGCIGIFLICFWAKGFDSLWIRIGVSIIGSIVEYVIVLVITKNTVLKKVMVGIR